MPNVQANYYDFSRNEHTKGIKQVFLTIRKIGYGGIVNFR